MSLGTCRDSDAKPRAQGLGTLPGEAACSEKHSAKILDSRLEVKETVQGESLLVLQAFLPHVLSNSYTTNISHNIEGLGSSLCSEGSRAPPFLYPVMSLTLNLQHYISHSA